MNLNVGNINGQYTAGAKAYKDSYVTNPNTSVAYTEDSTVKLQKPLTEDVFEKSTNIPQNETSVSAKTKIEETKGGVKEDVLEPETEEEISEEIIDNAEVNTDSAKNETAA